MSYCDYLEWTDEPIQDVETATYALLDAQLTIRHLNRGDRSRAGHARTILVAKLKATPDMARAACAVIREYGASRAYLREWDVTAGYGSLQIAVEELCEVLLRDDA